MTGQAAPHTRRRVGGAVVVRDPDRARGPAARYDPGVPLDPRARALLALALLLAPAPALAWSEAGHRIVGEIAEERLSPAARRLVKELLGSRPLSDPDVATWADEARSRSTAAWHYVNIPSSAEGYLASRDCPRKGCAVSAIDRFASQLRDADDPRAAAEALRWLVHLVADLHQPMHAGEGRDRGGNDTWVRIGRRWQPVSVHRLWDRQVVDPLVRRGDPLRVGRALAATIAPGDAAAWAGELSPAAWATESHLLARSIYRELQAFPMSHGRILLPASYPESQRPRVEAALARAGVRLAALLDRIALEREAH